MHYVIRMYNWQEEQVEYYVHSNRDTIEINSRYVVNHVFCLVHDFPMIAVAAVALQNLYQV